MSTPAIEPTVSNGHARVRPPAVYLLERGFPEWAILQAGWRIEPLGPERLRRYGLADYPEAAEAEVWVIPYLHRNGHVWFERIRFIRTGDVERFGGGKYRQPAGRGLALYDPYLVLGDETFEPRDCVLLIEGEANAVAAHTLVPDLPVIGLPGQKALTEKMAEALAHTPVIYLWIDRHDPGAEQNAQRIAERLREAGVDEVRQLPAPPGRRDANDLLREDLEHSRQFVRDMLDAAQPIEASEASGEQEWSFMPRPVPPPFPVDALPESIAAYVTALATQTQTAPDLAALAVLGVLSSVALPARVDCVNYEQETLGLYILAVSPSGDRKSTVLKNVAAPLYRLEKQSREEAKTRKREHEAEREMLQARKQALIRKASKLEDHDEAWAATQKELQDASERLAAAEEFVNPRMLSDDATPEALAELMSKHERGIAVISAESAIVDNLLGHYSDKGKANLHVVCKAYEAEGTSTDRRGSTELVIPRPLLAITLFAQPHVLENILGHGTAREQGLVARFILVDASAASYVGHRQIDPPPPKVPRHLHEAWEQTVTKVKTAIATAKPAKPANEGSAGGFAGFAVQEEQRLLTLTLSPSSKKLLTGVELANEPRQRDGGDLELFRDWIGRHHGRIARIATDLHLAEHNPAEPIAAVTMQRAIRIGDYILAHGLLALSTPDPLLRRTLKWLAEQLADGVYRVSQRDILNGPLGKNGKADMAAKLAGQAVECGALRPVATVDESPNPKGGRPPGPRYEINPRLREAVG